VTPFEKEEFWKALGRLYDASLKTHENIEELRATVTELHGTVDGLSGAMVKLLSATQSLQSVAESHERRLDRYEVTVEAVLEELRRRREGGTR
jgi:hypothetical protein